MPTKTPKTDAVEYNSARVKPERMAVDADFARDLERENETLRTALSNLLNTSAVVESDEDFTEITCVNEHYDAAYAALSNDQGQTRSGENPSAESGEKP
jgi:hypothetical protein